MLKGTFFRLGSWSAEYRRNEELGTYTNSQTIERQKKRLVMVILVRNLSAKVPRSYWLS